jgi:glycosyltransferase involved in cell wall biosynthesis
MAASSKKIVYWHYPHLKFLSGGTRFLLHVSKELQKKGFRVSIVCNLGDPKILQLFHKEKIHVVTTSSFSTNSLFYWCFFPFQIGYDTYQAWKVMKRGKYWIATLFPSNFILAILNKFTGRKFFYYCYEPFPFLHNSKFIDTFPFPKRYFLKALAFLYGRCDIWATQRAQQVLTLNDVTQKMNKKIYDVNSLPTLMGVDTKHFAPKKKNFVLKKYPKKHIILHSTDYTSMKRTDLAIKTLRFIVKKRKNVKLLITSTQPNSSEKRKYEKLVQKLKLDDYVEFLGMISYEELPFYYSAARCYLSCSLDEMLGTTSSNLPVKEALACGVPAIRANITREDVEDGKSGFLLNPNNTQQVAKKVLYLLSHPQKAHQMGLVGRKKIVKLYTWKRVASTIAQSLTSY